jgi:O-antigen/teichoic acid export membrane protein
LSGIQKLAGQTLWYGASSIAARFINYLLTPYLTYALAGAAYGEMSLIYAVIPFLNVIFTYGLETAYFRFSKTKEEEADVYGTAMISLIVTTTILTAAMLLFRGPLSGLIGVREHPEYFTYSAFIIAFDTLTALAFAKLRYEGRPVKFAVVRVLGIVVNIGFTYFFLSVCPRLQAADSNSFIGVYYHAENRVGYVVLANLIQAVCTFLLLFREVFSFRWQFNGALWRRIIAYSSPLILAGFAGMINETLDRLMLRWWTSAPSADAANFEVGMYSACYKLSLLITLSIQAFRMAAEPFFFATAHGQQPQRVYARVMKFFVIVVCFMFLAVVLFLDTWKYFISNRAFWQGLGVVPILLLANIFIGIYYNLSIWYKLSNKTMAGAWITLIGAAITVAINYAFIPRYGYLACAWATFFCYGSMMAVSYLWGQKQYRVPYPTKKLVAYLLICVALYGLYSAWQLLGLNVWVNRGVAVFLIGLFAILISIVERKELARFPLIGKYFASPAPAS